MKKVLLTLLALSSITLAQEPVPSTEDLTNQPQFNTQDAYDKCIKQVGKQQSSICLINGIGAAVTVGDEALAEDYTNKFIAMYKKFKPRDTAKKFYEFNSTYSNGNVDSFSSYSPLLMCTIAANRYVLKEAEIYNKPLTHDQIYSWGNQACSSGHVPFYIAD